MAKPSISPPLYEIVPRKNTRARAIELLILVLLVSLLVYRLLTLKHHGLPWLVALLCESCFTFVWILVLNVKWTQIRPISYPQRLLQHFKTSELPAVDMFVTTADAVLEPPILTMNTVLSLLAVDYPADKLACYVSDDGASPLTYYSLLETSKFAKIWVPFCKKYEITVRAPFRYFSTNSIPSQNDSPDFKLEWQTIKGKYEELCEKIKEASDTFVPCEFSGKLEVFSKIDKRNHPTIVQVILENDEANPNGLPHLIYISREKRPKHPHHFKAGAMNVLTRVSGVMTNAPFMLNVDCDMHVNNPQVILHAMCMLLGVPNERDSGFVQFPQIFYDGLKDDPFGNQMVVLYEYIGLGIAGIQGPLYGGTNCFHRRKVIYGLSPHDESNNGKIDDEDLHKKFGKSTKLIESAAQTFSRSTRNGQQVGTLSSIEDASKVAGCGYEQGTQWGTEVGWRYGSATEDVLTGIQIHGKGWRSMFCLTEPPSFLGCAPSCGPASMTQMKRWSTGVLEILFSSKSPIFATIYGKLQFRQCLAYTWLLVWALRSIPELVYAALPAYCIITDSYFLPKVHEPAFVILVTIFVIYHLYTLYEYLKAGQSIRAWWNNQRMARINCMTSWLFGFLSVILKMMGLSQTVFEVTKKDQSSTDDDNNGNNEGRFTFDESPIFVPGVTVLLVNLAALVIGVAGFRPAVFTGKGAGIGEMICSWWVVLCFWAFLKGLFGRGKYGIPASTILKSGVLALLFVHYSKLSGRHDIS